MVEPAGPLVPPPTIAGGEELGGDSLPPNINPCGMRDDDEEDELRAGAGAVVTCAFKICPSNPPISSASPYFKRKNSTVVSEAETTSSSLISSPTSRML